MKALSPNDFIFYTYVLLDPRKPGRYTYDSVSYLYEPFYVGKGHGNRVLNHVRDKSKNHKCHKIQSILKEGFACYFYTKIIRDVTEKEAINKEVELIKCIGRNDLYLGPLTNLTDGGDGIVGNIYSKEARERISKAKKGKKKSKETKRKMSESFKLRPPVSVETRIKMGISQRKRKGTFTDSTRKKISEANKNRTHSEETRKKISKANKGRKKSDEHKKKLGNARRGQKLSTEWKDKIRVSTSGEKNPMYNKKHSEESKIKMSETKRLNRENKENKRRG